MKISILNEKIKIYKDLRKGLAKKEVMVPSHGLEPRTY